MSFTREILRVHVRYVLCFFVPLKISISLGSVSITPTDSFPELARPDCTGTGRPIPIIRSFSHTQTSRTWCLLSLYKKSLLKKHRWTCKTKNNCPSTNREYVHCCKYYFHLSWTANGWPNWLQSHQSNDQRRIGCFSWPKNPSEKWNFCWLSAEIHDSSLKVLWNVSF